MHCVLIDAKFCRNFGYRLSLLKAIAAISEAVLTSSRDTWFLPSATTLDGFDFPPDEVG
jgi:hypothetical protein